MGFPVFSRFQAESTYELEASRRSCGVETVCVSRYTSAYLNSFQQSGHGLREIPVALDFEPLYRKVPEAALRDSELYELLALVDAIRDGRARDRRIAEQSSVRRLRMTHGQP